MVLELGVQTCQVLAAAALWWLLEDVLVKGQWPCGTVRGPSPLFVHAYIQVVRNPRWPQDSCPCSANPCDPPLSSVGTCEYDRMVISSLSFIKWQGRGVLCMWPRFLISCLALIRGRSELLRRALSSDSPAAAGIWRPCCRLLEGPKGEGWRWPQADSQRARGDPAPELPGTELCH